MNICIYGAASADLDQIYYDKTEQLGRLMAKRGHGLVFGGGETGLMGQQPEELLQKKDIFLESHQNSLINQVFCIRSVLILL